MGFAGRPVRGLEWGARPYSYLHYRKLSTVSGFWGMGVGLVMSCGMNGLEIIFKCCDWLFRVGEISAY